jgi:hypothetical protein
MCITGMVEASENGKDSSRSARPSGMNEHNGDACLKNCK